MIEEATMKGYSDKEAMLYWSFQNHDNKSVVEEFLMDGYVSVEDVC